MVTIKQNISIPTAFRHYSTNTLHGCSSLVYFIFIYICVTDEIYVRKQKHLDITHAMIYNMYLE